MATLQRYRSKRNFAVTPEPSGGGSSNPRARQFVVQKHWARRLHYDFRLELQGVMKSWAVPKGPSFDPADKRMAVHVEDHPLAYNRFEGRIPEKQYGAGKVIIWDQGIWCPQAEPLQAYRSGKLKFELRGHKLRGGWALIRMQNRRGSQDSWLLIKERDRFARPASEFSVIDEQPDSVAGHSPAARPRKVARRVAPGTLKPVLATLVDAPPADPAAWSFEIKFDGYRILTHVARGRVRLVTRNGNDWTGKLPHLVKALRTLRLKAGWLDGEIVMPGSNGAGSFQSLQHAFEAGDTGDIVYFLFDVPYYDGRDLTQMPLVERRELLHSLLARAPPSIRFSEEFAAPPGDLVASACRLGLEGIIGKRRDSHYRSRRSPDWIKLKCSQRQEFVIGGWTDPQGSRSGFGALLLGVHDGAGRLVYAGKVGTGFDGTTLRELSRQFKSLASPRRPFAQATPEERRAHWLRPTLVAEVTFSEWTRDGHLRHPVFQALRTDKPAADIMREQPAKALGADSGPAQSSAIPSQVRVSHPERVVDQHSGATKIEVVRYYGLVGPLMMEHLAARPVALLRAPQGVRKPTFFQKHLDKGNIEGVMQLDPRLDPDHHRLLAITSPLGLVSAAQMNVIEFHSWNALEGDIGRPDRMTFDLDPGEGVEWRSIRQAAELLRRFLDDLGLQAFLKTSGGKGLHLVTPIRRQHDWVTVKGLSQAIVQHVARTLPQMFVAKSGPRNRIGRIFIDYLRNGFGATTVSAWSLRARPGLGISMPVSWAELPGIRGAAHWTLRDVHDRLDEGNTPWKDYPRAAASLARPMKALGYRPAKTASR